MAFPSSPVNNQIASRFGRYFKYNSTRSRWEVVITPSVSDIQSTSISAIGDIDLTSNPPTDGQALSWNSTTGKFVPANLGSGTTAYSTLSQLPLSGNETGAKALVAENNTLYMWNGSGWYKIALVNTSPSITSGANASYVLNSDGTPTVITLAATDPEDVPITWSYTVTSGSLEDTTVTNSGGEFTITPGSIAATFDLTFTASDGINTDTSASSFTLAFGPNFAATTLKYSIHNPNAYSTGASDLFGNAVAIDGNYAIVGAYGEDDGGDGSGIAYVFDVTTGTLFRTLRNPNAYGTVVSDLFGRDVAIAGNYAVVPALNEDNAVGTETGVVYIFDITTGNLLHTLINPTPYPVDQFGWSVAAAGNYAIVGSLNADQALDDNSGKAYVYNITTGALLHTLNNPIPNVNDQFGVTVGISETHCIVGAYMDDTTGPNSGAAYIFDNTTGALVHTLANPNAYSTYVEDRFGYAVAISGNYAIVGAINEDDVDSASGKAYIFNVTTGALVHTLDNPNAYDTGLNDQFGTSVSISGNYAIVGTSNEDDAGGTGSGKAYIFNVTTGALVKTLDNPNTHAPSTNDRFGATDGVGISGEYVIVGAAGNTPSGTSSGSAYIFQAG